MRGINHNYLRLTRGSCGNHGGFQFGHAGKMYAMGAQTARMHGEVDFTSGTACGHTVVQHIVKTPVAGCELQALNAAETTVVQHDYDEFLAEHDGAGTFRIHHHV